MSLRSRLLPGYWLRHPLFSLILGLAGALVFATTAAGTWYETSRLSDHGVTATATLVDLSLGRDGHVSVEFATAGGRRIVTELVAYNVNSLPDVGKTLTIVYDPEDPALAGEAASAGDYSMSWVLFIAGIALATGTALFLAKTWAVWKANAEIWRVQ